jgi:excisionase family DNA binding protein
MDTCTVTFSRFSWRLQAIENTRHNQVLFRMTCGTSINNRKNRNPAYLFFMDETLLSIAEVADMLNISRDTVRRMFETEPGVINVGPRHRAGRQYRILRIPRSVLNRVMAARQVAQPDDSRTTKP